MAFDDFDIAVENEDGFLELLSNIDNLEYLESKQLKLSGTVIKLKFDGENFDASLPGSLIMGLAQYQEKIYRVYLTNKYGPGTKRKPTAEEAKMLDISVTVNQGCTEVLIRVLKDVGMEAINTMPAEHILPMALGIAGIAAVAYCVRGIGSIRVKELYKTKRKAIAEKKALAKNELEKKKLEFLESTVNFSMEAMRSVCDGIIRALPNSVAINDKVVPTENIASLAEEMAPVKPDVTEEQTVVSGTYRIQRVTLDYKKDTASADVFDVESGDPIRGIVLQSKQISDGSFRVLKSAQDHHGVKMQLIVTKRNDSIYKAILDKILE